MMVAALKFSGGLALLDILQPRVSFNRANTFRRYKDRVRPIDESHDPFDRAAALELAFKWGDEIPIGILYQSRRPNSEYQLPALEAGPLVERYPE